MVLYLAVTCDRYELPVYVCDTRAEMAAWMGITVASVTEQCSRNKNKPPYPVERSTLVRLRTVEVEDEKE